MRRRHEIICPTAERGSATAGSIRDTFSGDLRLDQPRHCQSAQRFHISPHSQEANRESGIISPCGMSNARTENRLRRNPDMSCTRTLASNHSVDNGAAGITLDRGGEELKAPSPKLVKVKGLFGRSTFRRLWNTMPSINRHRRGGLLRTYNCK